MGGELLVRGALRAGEEVDGTKNLRDVAAVGAEAVRHGEPPQDERRQRGRG